VETADAQWLVQNAEACFLFIERGCRSDSRNRLPASFMPRGAVYRGLTREIMSDFRPDISSPIHEPLSR